MTEKEIIVLPVTREIIEKTMLNTQKKYSYTYKTLMYNRTLVELLDNIYMGDIAKNALVSYLRSHSISVIDYDEIRTDNFMEHDPGWDFKIGKKMITVEVKSSIPPNNEPKSNLIKYRDIKITASHDKGKTWINPEDIDSNIHVQIYFYTKPYRNGYDSFDTLARDISTDYHLIDKIINASKYNEPLFAGWTTKENIIEYLNTLPKGQRTWTFSWTSRIYWKCPISQASNMSELINLIKSP